MTEISVIMGVRGRPEATRRTLQSYLKLEHKDYEIIYVDVLYDSFETMRPVFNEFKDRLPLRYFYLYEDFDNYDEGVSTWTPATTWNYGISKSEGKFVITTGADLLLTKPDLFDRFLSQYTGNRLSVLTYFLSHTMTDRLDEIDWYNNPECVKELPGFWDEVTTDNKQRLLASHTTYMTGHTREMWEWFGKFRSTLSHLVCDQDLRMRENYLGKQAETMQDYYVYHQAHPIDEEDITARMVSPGWNYHSELQARLIEPAPRD